MKSNFSVESKLWIGYTGFVENIHIEHVQRKFTDAEVLEFGQNQAQFIEQIRELEAQKKAAVDHFKDEIGQRKTAIAELATNINRGYEIIPTPCDVILNQPTPGMKQLVCRKTLAVIKTLPMDDSEKSSLFGGE